MKKQRVVPKKQVASAIAAAVSAILAQYAHAQSADATLRGKAPANSEVTAKNTETGLVRHVKVGADGNYTVLGLPPGIYQVDAGPGTAKVVQLSVATTATLDLQPEPIENVIVTAKHLVEVKTSEVGTGISLHQIETIPQLSRNFLEFADTVAGMSFQVDANGKTSIHSGAQDTSSTNVYIDGVGQKNYVRQGGISGQAGSDKQFGTRNPGDNGNPFPQLAIGEYKVITSNYKAEYDQISGAAITAETKSGTNTFHGQVFGNYTTGSWRSPTPAEEAAGGTKYGAPSKEYGFAVGGPIILDKLHFFFTYEGKKFTTPDVVKPPFVKDSAGNIYHPETFLPAGLRANYGPVANPFNEDLYFGKLDWEVSDADRLEFSAKYRKEKQLAGAGGGTAPSAAYNYLNDDLRTQLRWQHTNDRWFNDALITTENTKDQPLPLSDKPGLQYVFNGPIGTNLNAPEYPYQPLLQIDGQGARTFYHAVQTGFGLQDDLTFPGLSWAGDHTIKIGAKLKDVRLTESDASTAAVYSYYVTSAGVADRPFQVFFGNKVNNGIPITAESTNKQFGVYFQDDWVVNSHLTWNLGVRYDYEQTPTFTGFVTPANFVAAILGPDTQPGTRPGDPFAGQTYAQSLAKGGININDYISNGHNRKNPTNEIQPRLGFSVDINGDQRHVAFGGVGRAYDRNVFDILQKETTKAALSEPTIQFRVPSPNPAAGCSSTPITPLTPTCIDWSPAYLTPAGLQSIGGGAGEVDLIANNLKAPYSDQFSIGIRNKLGDWNTTATIVRINSHDGLVGRFGNRPADGSPWYSNTYGWGQGVPGIGTLILYDNAKETRNTQLLLSAEKAYTIESGWAATLAYTYSSAKENVYYSEEYQFDYPDSRTIPFHPSTAAARHRLVATGSVDVRWGITLGGKLTLETPKYNLGFGCCTPDPVNGYFYAAQYPKGQRFLLGGPAFGYRAIDVQATKDFDLPHKMVLQARVDVLNATNFKNYDASAAFNPYPNPAFYDTNGPIVGVPRTIKLNFDVKW